MLEVNTILDLDRIKEITEKGYSRIPVYKKDEINVCGIFYSDDIINILIERLTNQNNDWPKISSVARFMDSIHQVSILESKSLKIALELMRKGNFHMLIAMGENKNNGLEIKGIFTLEDVIEVLTDDIKDERDNEDDTSVVNIDDDMMHLLSPPKRNYVTFGENEL